MRAKDHQRVQKKLGALRRKNGRGRCWVCGSGAGVKMSREGYGSRCVRCLKLGKTNADVDEYERLKEMLGL